MPESKPHSELRAWIEKNDPTSIGMYLVEFDRLVEELEEQRTHFTLTRLDDAKAIGTIFDHSYGALEAAYAELERAEEHHRWHHEQEGRDVEKDDERLRVLMVIAEALEELPEPLSDDAETQVTELREKATRYAPMEDSAKQLLRQVGELSFPESVVVDENGAYWREFGDHYSMCPVSDDNEPVHPVAVYVPEWRLDAERDERRSLEEQLETAHNKLRAIATVEWTSLTAIQVLADVQALAANDSFPASEPREDA